MVVKKDVLAPSQRPDFSGIESGRDGSLFERGQWPARWIHSPDPSGEPHFLLFRRVFHLQQPLCFRAHITADERYRCWHNGQPVGQGPERGDPDDWFFDSYDFDLSPGEHTFLIRVDALGPASMRSQTSLRPGLLFAPESDEAFHLLGSGSGDGTGSGDWEVTTLPGYSFAPPFEREAFSVGFNCTHDGRRIDRLLESGQGGGWAPALPGLPGADPAKRNRYPTTHLLNPGLLPARRHERFRGGKVAAVEELNPKQAPDSKAYSNGMDGDGRKEGWEQLYAQNAALTLPAGTRLRVLLDLEDYIGVAYALAFQGAAGASIQVGLAEALFEEPAGLHKGNRSRVEGKFFKGIGDTFIASGAESSERFEAIFWRSGRFVELTIDTKDAPMRIESLELYRVGFPIEWDYAFSSDDDSLHGIPPLVERTLAASTDDSFMDGPYYEQMLWVGDLVQTQLTHFVTHLDLPLARKAIRSFDASRMRDGLTCARWPARDRMIIAPYSLHWIEAIHDHALWRGELDTLRPHMRGVRGVVDALLEMRNADGLLEIHKGWNMVDWVPAWPMGVPPGADGGVSSILNWQLVRVLGKYAELERLFDEPEMAARADRIADQLAGVLCAEFWDEKRGLFRDATGHNTFSEHAQALAILSNRLTPAYLEPIAHFSERDIIRATISFSHFVFEALFEVGRPWPFFERLNAWKLLPENGFLTLPEGPEPSRSDCHAWGSHPLYHLLASVLGVRPAKAGFSEVQIRPQLGPLQSAGGKIPHPHGTIEVAIDNANGRSRTTVKLPDGLSGRIRLGETWQPLTPGHQQFEN